MRIVVTLKVMQVVLLALAANATMALAAEAAVSVIAGDATGTPGALVTVSVSLNPGGALVAGVQNDLEFDPGVSAPDLVNGKPNCHANPDIGKNLGVSLRSAGSMRALVFSLLDNSPIPAGPLYLCEFRIAAAAVPGSYSIRISNLAASDASGRPVLGLVGQNGRVTVTDLEPVAIDVGSATGAAGDVVSMAVSMTGNGHAVRSMQNDIAFDATTLRVVTQDGAPDCQANSDIGAQLAAHVLDGGDTLRVVVLSLNQVSPIPDGVLYTCSFSILPNATPGDYALVSANVVVSDPRGEAVNSVGHDGSILVFRSSCAGDCDGNGAVTIDELITAINIALGLSSIDACHAADIDGDGAVIVPEILRAVINAQLHCPL